MEEETEESVPAKILAFPVVFLAINLLPFGFLIFVEGVLVHNGSLSAAASDLLSELLSLWRELIFPATFLFLLVTRCLNLQHNLALILIANGLAIALPMFYFMGTVKRLAPFKTVAQLFTFESNPAVPFVWTHVPGLGLIALGSALIVWLFMFKATSIAKYF